MISSKNILINTSTFDLKNNPYIEELKKTGFNINTNPLGRRLTENEVSNFMSEYKPLGIIAGLEPLTSNILYANPELKVISRCGTGLDNIDMDAARELNIIITNTPDAVTNAVAELTIGVMLNILRHINESDGDIRRGGFKKIMGRLLHQCTVGIIGYGRIGKSVGNLCRAFGADVFINDLIKEQQDEVKPVSLEELLRMSDIVTLHLSTYPGNSYLMTRERIFGMKKGAVLINNARGNLVDESALYDALKCNHIAGAALDVFENEPYSGNLIELDNVLLTAHLGSYAIEVRRVMELESAQNLLNELKYINNGISGIDK